MYAPTLRTCSIIDEEYAPTRRTCSTVAKTHLCSYVEASSPVVFQILGYQATVTVPSRVQAAAGPIQFTLARCRHFLSPTTLKTIISALPSVKINGSDSYSPMHTCAGQGQYEFSATSPALTSRYEMSGTDAVYRATSLALAPYRYPGSILCAC
eukprot:2071764-Rhodomonas_salina.1